MPIGEIDPVIYGSLPGYIISGYQTSATTVASGSVNAGDAQEFFVVEQSLDIDYVRKRDFWGFSFETSSYSLSGASTFQFSQATNASVTRLYCRVKGYTRGYRAVLNFSGNYVQNQIFAVYPNSNDVYGQNYGTVSAGSGILSSVKLGPGGIIRTVVPGYQRFFWSSLSGYGTSAYPASGWNQTIDAYNFAISMDDCFPPIVTLASGTAPGSPISNVPALSGIGVNFYLGAPTYGTQWKKESQFLYDPMYTFWPESQDNSFTFTKKSPETIIDHGSFIYGNYNTSNEPNIIARTFINNVGTAVSIPFAYTSPYNKICNFYNSELYWNSDIQILYGVPYGRYAGGISIAAPVMDRYRTYLHYM